MNANRAMLIAIPAIFIFVLLLTYLGLFQSYELLAVVVVMYIVVSVFNRRKFKKQAEAKPPTKQP